MITEHEEVAEWIKVEIDNEEEEEPVYLSPDDSVEIDLELVV